MPNARSVPPRGNSTAPVQIGAGDVTTDCAFRAAPATLTTIAWRLGRRRRAPGPDR
ncbi:hypothetical protein [Streptomyces sp. NPDC050704]|uniref:hypothetical protein n=1 Tax=Streptomyces sp. NPDC050704 TaxID=3157219 RepID=UPI00343EFFE8